jgi:hypothetical protein
MDLTYIFDNTTGYLIDIPPGVCNCLNCPDWVFAMAGGFIAGMAYGVIICVIIWRCYGRYNTGTPPTE